MLDFCEKKQQRMSFPEYIEALERERSKVEVFRRELPLCLELLQQAIEACKQQLSGTTTEYNSHGQSECSEQTSTDEGPTLEEFIPIRKRAASDFRDGEVANAADDGDEQHSHQSKISRENDDIDKTKSDWLSSVQLWNPDPPVEEDVRKKETVVEAMRNGGAFKPFQKEKNAGKTDASTSKASTSSVPAPSSSSTGERDREEDQVGSEKKSDKEGLRKQRRCWSPELHKRFLNAVQQLGGSDVATPKQIRELMKVDGLTNDEVKSHLQKYRLHTRRPSSTIHNNANPQAATQFVVVGGLWVQPPEFAAAMATTCTAAAATTSGDALAPAPSNGGIYAPVATHPPLAHRPKSNRAEQSEEERAASRNSHSNSPASSSSTH